MSLDKQTLFEAARICMIELPYGPVTVPKLYWEIAEELRVLAAQQPESSWGASKQEEPNEPINTLLRFYGVLTLSALVLAQSHHIERLQSKLPLLKDERPGYVPREG